MKRVHACVVVLVVSVLPAFAMAERSSTIPGGAMLNTDGMRVTVGRSPYLQAQRAEAPPPTLSRVFDNLAEKYPDGLYWAYSSWSVCGPNAGCGAQVWLATSFTPTADANVTRLEVAVKLISGSNHLVLSLRSDNAGLPGTVLQKWVLKNLLPQGTCCETKAGTSTGIPVKAAHQYWIVLSTDTNSKDTFAGWSYNDTSQLAPVALARNYGSGWSVAGQAPAPAFAVFSSP